MSSLELETANKTIRSLEFQLAELQREISVKTVLIRDMDAMLRRVQLQNDQIIAALQTETQDKEN